MGFKEQAVIGLTVVGLLVGVDQALAPRTVEENHRQMQEQRWQDLSDSVEDERDGDETGSPRSSTPSDATGWCPVSTGRPELPRLRLRWP